MELRLSPELVDADIASHYKLDKRVRLENVLPLDQASQLSDYLANKTKYDIATFFDQKPANISTEELNKWGKDKAQEIQRKINQNAAMGIGYVYGRHKIYTTGDDNPLTHTIKWLNSEAMLEWARRLSGHQDIVSASAQATRYVPGNFLTRHNDINEQEQRRVAYVLSFNQDWHPDWGGLLQFYEANGTPRDAWSPGFNTLSLFDVSHIHSVTYITQFAPKPRFSITGWFRAAPL
ncbi:2OG-Fe(II) oxygenase [Aestuariibacter salexigens]|uniref:2OG-Fe(II) oxygenase n=1 Tax=Aestuariibacter salexigens TaxID=226010 RepID=UPI0004243918|nr:2OG-Fe(II) oxygenase family protein [Aestuariibacter salexigens]